MKWLWLSILLASSTIAHCVEAPKEVAEHSLVRVTAKPDALLWVLTVRDGQLARVDNYKSQGILIFTGPPGVYTIIGTEDGRDFQEFVTIRKSGNAPDPPKPDPPPDPPKPPVFPDTPYDVGPQVRWYCVQQQLTKGQAKQAAAAFAEASSISARVQLPLDGIAKRLETALRAAGWNDATLTAYGDLFEQRWDEGKFRTLMEHAKAWWEVAQYLDDSLKDTTPEWLAR